MTRSEIKTLFQRFADVRIGVIGDFAVDFYFDLQTEMLEKGFTFFQKFPKKETDLLVGLAEEIAKTINDVYEVKFEYLLMNDAMRVIKEEHIQLLKQEFDTSCLIHIEVRKAQLNTVLAKFEKIEGVNVKYLYTC